MREMHIQLQTNGNVPQQLVSTTQENWIFDMQRAVRCYFGPLRRNPIKYRDQTCTITDDSGIHVISICNN